MLCFTKWSLYAYSVWKYCLQIINFEFKTMTEPLCMSFECFLLPTQPKFNPIYCLRIKQCIWLKDEDKSEFKAKLTWLNYAQVKANDPFFIAFWMQSLQRKSSIAAVSYIHFFASLISIINPWLAVHDANKR